MVVSFGDDVVGINVKAHECVLCPFQILASVLLIHTPLCHELS